MLAMLLSRSRVLPVVLLAALVAAGGYFAEEIGPLLTLRFNSTASDSSDLLRDLQNPALRDFFADAPILGHGLGSFTSEIIRSPDLPYSYENQNLATLGQVGLVGTVLLLILLMVYFRSLLYQRSLSPLFRLSLLALLLMQLISGFLNPGVISSTASVTYGTLLALVYARTSDAAARQ
jgi:O-antigen ligase